MKARNRFPVWVWGIAFLALAALACEPPPITGITCLRQRDDGTIIAPEEFNTYSSADGGLTWQETEPESNSIEGCAEQRTTPEPWTQTDPANPNVMYRFNPELSIERSEDGGRNWHREVDLSGTEARNIYYQRNRPYTFNFIPGPLDSLFDSSTGNLIVAMGYEGVLVRTPDARWHWVAVGRYSRVDMRDLSITLPLISWELWLALLLGAVITGSLPTLSKRRNLWPVSSSVLGSILAIGIMLIIVYALAQAILIMFKGDAYTTALYIVGAVVLAILVGVPTWISSKIAASSQPENKLAFVWSGVSWTIMIILFGMFVWSVFSSR